MLSWERQEHPHGLFKWAPRGHSPPSINPWTSTWTNRDGTHLLQAVEQTGNLGGIKASLALLTFES